VSIAVAAVVCNINANVLSAALAEQPEGAPGSWVSLSRSALRPMYALAVSWVSN
jgi:hypothetical protein